ncbi:MAG: 4-hydroxy-3-methylbut-2-enyl diphosphate reductase [Crocinitomicaceae bacterium]|nr:4-hydroxy-3-methylbut-2-enyl diphosphate reductase [Crocinitomicaceae bacterium]
MKTFEIPHYYRSPVISRVKAMRSAKDKLKKDFSPTLLNFGNTQIILARHFGFCYGVENAIEISYRAIHENPGKKIYLLSQMIHNPEVNADLIARGVQFLQDTKGNQIIPFNQLTADDIVIIPAFGTTREIEQELRSRGIQLEKYDTTCPFVQRVWKKSEKLGSDQYTVIIHGKDKHEETRATFSHTNEFAKALVIRDITEAKQLAEVILGTLNKDGFARIFTGRFTEGFDPAIDLNRIGVVNQTTMLASETQEISDYLQEIMVQKYGASEITNHFANTRDTLCYATNDNQSATLELLNQQADIAIVVGGYNSSNTSHLVELCETKFPTYFIQDEKELISENEIHHFDLHSKEMKTTSNFLVDNRVKNIIVTSGASCPDATVDRVIQKILTFTKANKSVDAVLAELM